MEGKQQKEAKTLDEIETDLRCSPTQLQLDCHLHAVAVGNGNRKRRLKLCTELIELGAGVDNQAHKCGSTPLFHALAAGHDSLVDLLLSRSADVNLPNAYGAPQQTQQSFTCASSDHSRAARSVQGSMCSAQR